MENTHSQTALRVPLDLSYLPITTSFAEQAAGVMGLSGADALKLTLAAEEVFTYLVRVSPGETIAVEAQGAGYYGKLTFIFRNRDLDLRLFNLTAQLAPDDEQDLDELGLLVASRTVDRFDLVDEPQQGTGLVLIKEKTYPVEETPPPPLPALLENFEVVPAGPEDLITLARLLKAHTPVGLYPSALAQPAKLMDMVHSGEYWAMVAKDPAEHLGGAVLWTPLGDRMMRMLGPYLFGQSPGEAMAQALVEACLAGLAKSGAAGVISLFSTPGLPPEYFEPLGDLEFLAPDGGSQKGPCHFRQLQEDPGGVVWAHAGVEAFLAAKYRDLAFAREIRLTGGQGRQVRPHSVFAVRFDRTGGMASIRPLWEGADAASNLAGHLALLQDEGMSEILCELDLGHAWQGHLAGALLDLGFEPRLVLPHGGKGDLLMMQHRSA